MNPHQYNISRTSEFNPFSDYREGPSRREPSVERDLPIYDDGEDDEIVPETQFGIIYTRYFFLYTLFFFYIHVVIFFLYTLFFFTIYFYTFFIHL